MNDLQDLVDKFAHYRAARLAAVIQAPPELLEDDLDEVLDLETLDSVRCTRRSVHERWAVLQTV